MFQATRIYVMYIRRLKEMRCVVCVSGYKDIQATRIYDVHSSVEGNDVCCLGLLVQVNHAALHLFRDILRQSKRKYFQFVVCQTNITNE